MVPLNGELQQCSLTADFDDGLIVVVNCSTVQLLTCAVALNSEFQLWIVRLIFTNVLTELLLKQTVQALKYEVLRDERVPFLFCFVQPSIC